MKDDERIDIECPSGDGTTMSIIYDESGGKLVIETEDSNDEESACIHLKKAERDQLAQFLIDSWDSITE